MSESVDVSLEGVGVGVLSEQACKNENIRNEVEDGSWLLR